MLSARRILIAEGRRILIPRRSFWCLPDPGFSHDWPWALPTACQPSLQRGVRGVSPRLKKKQRPSPLPPSLSALRLSLLSLSLFLLPSFCCPFPGSCSRGPSLPGRRTLLTRQADPPYPAGGPCPYPAGRTPLARQAAGGYSLLTARSGGGYSLLGRRALLTQKADTPYPKGGYSFGDLPHLVRI